MTISASSEITSQSYGGVADSIDGEVSTETPETEDIPDPDQLDTDPIVIDFPPEECEELIAKAINLLPFYLQNERKCWFYQGRCFRVINLASAKCGSGRFLQECERIQREFGISRRTVYRRMDYYRAVVASEIDIRDFRLCHRGNDYWLEETMEIDNSEAMAAADKKAAEQQNTIDRLTKKHGKRSSPRTGGPADVTKFAIAGLSKAENRILKQEFEGLLSLGPVLRSEIVEFIHEMYNAHRDRMAPNTPPDNTKQSSGRKPGLATCSLRKGSNRRVAKE